MYYLCLFNVITVGLTFLAPKNIRINAVAPSLIDAPMSERAKANDEIMRFVSAKQPLDGGRIGLPEDLNGAAIFLMSDAAKFVTGQALTIDGGWSLSEGNYQ